MDNVEFHAINERAQSVDSQPLQ